MKSDIGAMLQTMRFARGLSLRALADSAGIGKSTLAYWEAGRFQPRLPELESILTALQVSAQERREALWRIDAPRAAQQLQREAQRPLQEAILGPLPSGGDLLRAMRHRQGMQQEQVAAALHVSAGTVSRWEQGRVAPTVERLNNLCDLLGAEAEEQAVLREGTCFLRPPLRFVMTSSDALREQCAGLLWPNYYHQKVTRNDLLYLTTAAHAWEMAGQEQAGQILLAELYTNYASYIVGSRRYEEAGRYAERALDLLPPTMSDHVAMRAALVRARAKAYRPLRPAIQSAIQTLRPWTKSDVPSRYRAWAMEGISEYLALQGAWSSAIAVCQEACQIAARSEDPADLREQRMKLAKLLIRAGQPAAALPLLSYAPEDLPALQTEISLRRAEALLALGDRSEAYFLLEKVCAEIEAHDLSYLRLQIAPLQSQIV